VDVYLIRHAEAVEETLVLPDPSRHLSPRGRAQAAALGERLRWHDCLPVVVWTSPLVRAVQTAELIVVGLRHAGDVIADPELAPGGDPHAIQRALAALPATASVVLVGHEPGLSGLGGVLVGRRDFAGVLKAEAVKLTDGVVKWRFGHADEAPRPPSKP